MTELTIDRANSWSGALENWAEEKVKDASAPLVVGLRMVQGLGSLLAVAETVMWVAFSVLMIPVSLCWCFAPDAVKSFDKFVLNGLAGAAAAIVTPWKQAIASCCCNGLGRRQIEDSGDEGSDSSGNVLTLEQNDEEDDGFDLDSASESGLGELPRLEFLGWDETLFSKAGVMEHLVSGGGLLKDNRYWFLNEDHRALFSQGEIGQVESEETYQEWTVQHHENNGRPHIQKYFILDPTEPGQEANIEIGESAWTFDFEELVFPERSF